MEEAFYFTVKDPKAVNMTIEELLNQYALNPDLQDQLDTQDNPDLPFMQEELIQYQRSAKNGLMDIEYYINYNPFAGPIPLSRRAKDMLCVCTYDDDSNDYRVLDLIIVPSVHHLQGNELQKVRKEYGYIFMLLLFEHFDSMGRDDYLNFLKHPAVKGFLDFRSSSDYPEFHAALGDLERRGLVKREMGSLNSSDISLILTEKGTAELQNLHAEQQKLEQYDIYDSVAAHPAGLGVPDGFDARVQMMQLDGIDTERAMVLCVLDQNKDVIFGDDTWCDNFESFSFYHIVQDALAYKTNFTADVLQELKGLGQG